MEESTSDQKGRLDADWRKTYKELKASIDPDGSDDDDDDDTIERLMRGDVVAQDRKVRFPVLKFSKSNVFIGTFDPERVCFG